MMMKVTGSTNNESLCMPACRSLASLSLGGVAAMNPPTQLPKKYRAPKSGEASTYQGAGIVPVTRLANGEVRVLLWQPQSGKKKGVRWYDFGGRKEHRTEFSSACACRKLAKQTYGVFGCKLDILDATGEVAPHLAELYQGLANLPLMLRASQEWARLQLLDDAPRIFYNDIHEYHTYLLCVPQVPAEVLTQISQIVDSGKRVFRWMTPAEIADEVLAPRLHTASFTQQLERLQEDAWVRHGKTYGDGVIGAATGCFSATVLDA